jgi:peptidoglycan hydrolase-like protein with peptidoglycan-binding domain
LTIKKPRILNTLIRKAIIPFVLLFIGNFMFSQDFPGIIELRNDRMYSAELKHYGFDEFGEIDGYYGPLTENMIKTIQRFSGFEENGIVDKRLWEFEPVRNFV